MIKINFSFPVNHLKVCIKEGLYRIWCGMNRLGDCGVHKVGDTSAFINT